MGRTSIRWRFVVIGLAIVAGVWLLIFGPHWPGAKLSAGETAHVLKHESPTWKDVRCTAGSDGWDYRCTYRVAYGGGLHKDWIGVDVDATQVTGQTAP